jgi:hypothetical protein
MPGSIKESARTSSLPSRVAAPFLCAVGASRPLHSHHCDGRLWARIIRSVAHLVLRLAALGDLATRGRTSCEHWGKNLGNIRADSFPLHPRSARRAQARKPSFTGFLVGAPGFEPGTPSPQKEVLLTQTIAQPSLAARKPTSFEKIRAASAPVQGRPGDSIAR